MNEYWSREKERKDLRRTTTVGTNLKHIMYDVSSTRPTASSKDIRSHSSFDDSFCDHLQAASITLIVVLINREVEAISTVDLDIQEARADYVNVTKACLPW